MIKKLCTLLAVLALFAAACGGSTVEDAEATVEDELAEDELATGTDSGSDSDTSASDDASSRSGTDGDQSLVDASEGPLGVLLFDDTIEAGDAPTSARFEGRLTITGGADSDLPGTVNMNMSGAYDRANDASRMTMDMSELIAAATAAESEQVPPGMEDFFKEPLEVIVIGDQGWMKWGILSMFTGEDNVWIELSPEDVESTTEGFGFSSSAGDPTEMLDALAEADATIEDLGVEEVNGVMARHWRALADLEELSADASAQELDELEAQFGDLNATQFPIDVWIGVDDGLIYRYVLDLSSEAFFDGSETGEIESSTMTFDFFDYGADQGINPPPADEVIDGDNLFTS